MPFLYDIESEIIMRAIQYFDIKNEYINVTYLSWILGMPIWMNNYKGFFKITKECIHVFDINISDPEIILEILMGNKNR